MTSKRYPWHRIERGQGFFIPCLNLEQTKKEGLDEALRYRVFDAKAIPATREGLIGVWFYRRSPSRS
jgi:hypothetical protein